MQRQGTYLAVGDGSRFGRSSSPGITSLPCRLDRRTLRQTSGDQGERGPRTRQTLREEVRVGGHRKSAARLLREFQKLLATRLPTFKTREEAMEWLVEDEDQDITRG